MWEFIIALFIASFVCPVMLMFKGMDMVGNDIVFIRTITLIMWLIGFVLIAGKIIYVFLHKGGK